MTEINKRANNPSHGCKCTRSYDINMPAASTGPSLSTISMILLGRYNHDITGFNLGVDFLIGLVSL